MAKHYVVTLGMQEREVRYRLQERRDLEAKYRKGLMRILREDVLANQDGHATLGGMLDVQYDVIWHGLRHIGKPLTEKKVVEYLDKLIEDTSGLEDKNPFAKVLGTCCDAIAASGILGFKLTEDEEDSVETGKVTASPSPVSNEE